MPGLILASGVTPDNTPHGYNLTFGFPMLLFIIIGAILYMLLFARPHPRVPARRPLSAQATVPEASAARGAAVADGLPVAPGGGGTESHLEPGGAAHAAEAEAGTGIVSGQDGGPDDAGQPGGETSATQGTEADE